MAEPAKKKGGRPKKLDLTKHQELCALLSAHLTRTMASQHAGCSVHASLNTVLQDARFRHDLQQWIRHQLAQAASRTPDVAMIRSRPSVTKVTTFDD